MQVHLIAYAADGAQAGLHQRAAVRGPRAGTHVGRPPARGAGRAARRASAARMLAARWGRRLPEQYKASLRPADRRRGRGLPGAAGDGRRRPRRGAGRPRRRRARACRSTSVARRSSWPRHAAARAPRPARDRGAPDAPGGRARAVGAGVHGARPRRRAAGPRAHRRAGGGDAARASGAASPSPTRSTGWSSSTELGWPQVEILRAYRRYRQRIGSRYTESFQNDVIAANPAITEKLMRLSSCASVPASERRRADGRGSAARRDPRGPRRRRAARPRPHPAQPARPDRGDGAHQRLRAGARRDGLQAALAGGPGDPAARAAVRDLRLRARHGGHPPARRADRARRHPLVGPHGLPHRGLRPDARADDQERGHRAGGREGRVLPQGAPDRPAPRSSARSSASTCATSRRCSTSPTTSSTARSRHPEGVARPRRGRHLPGRRRRQGHGDVLRHGQRDRAAARVLARRRIRLGRLGGL